jgi:tetratricopeptide (TPR) repeat protein
MWRASEFSVLQEHLAESAHWNAIDYFEKAGKRGQAINLLTQFVSGRSTSNRMPEALNRLGSLLQSVGRFEPAITVYQTCIRDFPRTVEGNRALLLLAQSYLRSGPQYQQESEDTLRLIVDNSELFGPSSPEYIEALGGLGELYSMNGEYEKAIPVLEEALLRVGHRGNLLKIRFNLADALRRVGLQIRDQRASAQYVEDQERLKGQEFEALARAGDIYRRIFSQFTANDNNDTGLPQVLHQQSRQYYADCMFFMGRFEEALAYYQEIAWLHRDEVTALSAYVQIINCYLSLESIHEARTAVRRAIQLTESLPREAFVNAPPKGGQVQWRQFFSWIENSSLFDA